MQRIVAQDGPLASTNGHFSWHGSKTVETGNPQSCQNQKFGSIQKQSQNWLYGLVVLRFCKTKQELWHYQQSFLQNFTVTQHPLSNFFLQPHGVGTSGPYSIFSSLKALSQASLAISSREPDNGPSSIFFTRPISSCSSEAFVSGVAAFLSNSTSACG